MRRIAIASLLAMSSIAMSTSLARAQEGDSTYRAMDSIQRSLSTGHIVWYDVKESAHDGWDYVVRPLYWSGREWLIVGTVAGFTVMLEYADDPIAKSFVDRNHGKFGDALASFGNNFYGNGNATALTFLSLYSIGLATDNSRLRVMGRQVLQSFAYAGLTTTVIKILFGRDRPFNNSGPNIFHGFTLNDAWNSLPSGHVTVACALSETLAADIDQTWVYAGFYTLEAATVFGRLYADAHWLSDTFAGAVIGNVVGFWVSREMSHYDEKTNDPKETSLEITPTIGGLNLTYKF
ncbi:MAG TPA: phosphatase PAP2 family protein [Candidatus Kapabacteria bacterium]